MTRNRESNETSEDAGGDRRHADRRGAQRRRNDRRALAPPWRRPAAYIAYGVASSLLAIVGFRGIVWPTTRTPPSPTRLEAIAVPASAEGGTPTTAPTNTRDGRSVSEYEILLAEGESALGQVVRTDLYCQTISQMSLRQSPTTGHRLNEVADSEGRVGVAECRWGDASRGADFFLVIPSDLAASFTEIPEEEMSFVLRRKVAARVEWLGRSEALSLRTAGILRALD